MKKNINPGFTKPLNVLIVEDSEVDRRVLESMVASDVNQVALLKSAKTLAEAYDLLSEHEFNVIILDLNLPDSKGQDTIKKLGACYPDVAIVVNTGAYEIEAGLYTLSAGAQDFLVKGKYDFYFLNKSLHYAVERKRLELELINAYEKLKETQAQLVQAEKLHVVGGLASGVAHEVKNPLSTILYGITYLEQHLENKGGKIEFAITNIKEAVARADRIITDLLDFSGLKKLKKEEESINAIVDKSLSLIQHEILKNNISVTKSLDTNNPRVLVDINRIEQVVVNLMLNAIQAVSPKGEIEVKTSRVKLSGNFSEGSFIDRTKFRAGQEVVILEISDNGEGIPEEEIDKIFDPFFTKKRGTGGVGLGLAISKNIIDIHEGDLIIENRRPKGVRAVLVLNAEASV